MSEEENIQTSNVMKDTKRHVYKQINLSKNNLPYESEILNNDLIDSLRDRLGSIYQSKRNWSLKYSIRDNGRSLNNLIHHFKVVDTQMVMLIEETNGNIFGALFSFSLSYKISRIGDSGTRLFKFDKKNNFKWYEPTGINSIYCHSCSQFLAFGCSDGRYGLVLNKTLVDGESNTVSTFNNEVLSEKNKFVIGKLEVWSLE